jgi:hypothetical protein
MLLEQLGRAYESDYDPIPILATNQVHLKGKVPGLPANNPLVSNNEKLLSSLQTSRYHEVKGTSILKHLMCDISPSEQQCAALGQKREHGWVGGRWCCSCSAPCSKVPEGKTDAKLNFLGNLSSDVKRFSGTDNRQEHVTLMQLSKSSMALSAID